MKLARLALLLLPVTAAAQSTAPFCARLRALTADPAVASAHWGIAVETLDGTLLCGINEAQLFRPASNAKLFTAGAALALLGPADRVTTVVRAPLTEQGTIHGDLLLIGADDGLLSDRAIPYLPPNAPVPPLREHPLLTLARQIAAAGVTHITGDIVGDDSTQSAQPYAPDWTLEDTRWGYGAPIAALSADDNKLALTVTPAARAGEPATVTLKPDTGFYTILSTVSTVASAADAHISLAPIYSSAPRQLIVSGSVALRAPYTDDIAISDPALYAALRLKSMIEAQGITIDGAARARHPSPSDELAHEQIAAHTLGVVPSFPVSGLILDPPARPGAGSPAIPVLASVASPPLLEDVTLTLKVSQNLHAELLLRRLSAVYSGFDSTAQGVRLVRQFWLDTGLSHNDFVLYDGSGLSGHDLVAPRAFAQLLVFEAKQPWFAGFKLALPIGGVDGSLAARFTGTLKGKVFAKTGTLGESRALSGYVTAASGKTLVFSILVDDHLPTTTADRTVMDHMVELIAATN